MTFVLGNQLPLLILFFVAGSIGTGFLFRKPAGHRVWRLADLVWVLLGGLGALGAILAGVYTKDSSRIERQIDVAYAASTRFDTDAARFRLRYCDQSPSGATSVLCDKVEFLSASTAGNAELPLFIAVTDRIAPLSGLNLFFGKGAQSPGDMSDMRAVMEDFDPAEFIVFASQDAATAAAIDMLKSPSPRIVADYRILARGYDRLIMQIATLKEEWKVLEDNAFILLLQIISLCLVSFAAPFRLGKSIVELR